MASECGNTIYDTSDTSGTLDSQIGFFYDDFRSCITTIQVNTGRQVVVTFDYFEIEEFGITCPDYLHIFDGGSVHSPRLSPLTGLCGTETPGTFSSTENQLTLQFVTDGDTSKRGFYIVYTSFTEGGACDGTDDFMCHNGRCVDSSLQDDGKDNCGDNSDETTTVEEAMNVFQTIVALGIGVIIAIVAGIVLLCVACCLGFYCCFCRNNKTQTVVTNVTQPNVTAVSMATHNQAQVPPQHQMSPPPPPLPPPGTLQVAPASGQSAHQTPSGPPSRGNSYTTVTYHSSQPNSVGLPGKDDHI
ncbi:uncharacterized protein LOC144358575 [Saccoglossus kowalevskii]